MKIPSYLYHTKMSGIYCIENSINHKKYIGSSLNVYQRLHVHKVKLTKNKHENQYLQNAVNKYKIENFECYLIEIVENTDLLTSKEQYWIDKLTSEYNLTKEIMRNIISSEARTKISETLKRGYADDSIHFTKVSPIDVYDINGVYIKSFPTIRSCSRELDIHVGSIIRVLKGVYTQAKSYQFKYTKDNKIMLPLIKSKYFSHNNRVPVPVKLDKLLENPEEDNQQPS